MKCQACHRLDDQRVEVFFNFGFGIDERLDEAASALEGYDLIGAIRNPPPDE